MSEGRPGRLHGPDHGAPDGHLLAERLLPENQLVALNLAHINDLLTAPGSVADTAGQDGDEPALELQISRSLIAKLLLLVFLLQETQACPLIHSQFSKETLTFPLEPASLFRESLAHHPLKQIFSTDLVIPLLFAAVLEWEEGDQS